MIASQESTAFRIKMEPFTKTWTVTLEDQGVATDLARHRRSVNATIQCQTSLTIERYDPRQGKRRSFVVACQNPAISLDERDVNRCLSHRQTAQS